MADTCLITHTEGCRGNLAGRNKRTLSYARKTVKEIAVTSKWRYLVKYTMYIAISALVIRGIFISSMETSPGIGMRGEGEPRGSVSGYVYDRQGNPIQGVQVGILGDQTLTGESDSKGFYTVNNVLGGVHTLWMVHKDYTNDSMLMDLEEGVHDTLSGIKLCYAYYTFAGKVVCNGRPVSGAGVTVAGCPVSTVTDAMGKYVLKKVPKNRSLKLIYAKNKLGFNTVRPMTVLMDDTTWISDVELIYTGAEVRGTVYDTSGTPVEKVVVMAVGGGLVDTTDRNGKYKMENVPSNEPTICIFAPPVNGVYGAIAGINVRENTKNTRVDIHMRPVTEVQERDGMAIHASEVIIIDTVSGVQFTEYPLIDMNTLTRSFRWHFA